MHFHRISFISPKPHINYVYNVWVCVRYGDCVAHVPWYICTSIVIVPCGTHISLNLNGLKWNGYLSFNALNVQLWKYKYYFIFDVVAEVIRSWKQIVVCLPFGAAISHTFSLLEIECWWKMWVGGAANTDQVRIALPPRLRGLLLLPGPCITQTAIVE